MGKRGVEGTGEWRSRRAGEVLGVAGRTVEGEGRREMERGVRKGV